MQHLKPFELYESFNELTPDKEYQLNRYYRGIWSQNPITGLIDINGDYNSTGGELRLLDLSFGTVSGNFNCEYNKLTSLKGSPHKVGGNFICNGNQLISLLGAPSEVIGNFHCSYNKLKSLVGAPKQVGGNFECIENNLTTLVGSPEKVKGHFHCYYNKLKSLEGAPFEIGGDFFYHVPGGGSAYMMQKINWNTNGWIKGLEKLPGLFLPFLRNLPPQYYSPKILAKIKELDPTEFNLLLKRLGDGVSVAADLGEFGF